jgi:hypothetical protein
MSIENFGFSGSSDSLSSVLDLQLTEYVVEVFLDCSQGDKQRFSNLAV